jgi:hypothetical protein
MTLVLIWLALSVVVGACVCRLLALSGPGNGKLFPESAVAATGQTGSRQQTAIKKRRGQRW